MCKLYNKCMGTTRKQDKKVRITIRAYESTIKQIKESGSTLQKEWDLFVESRFSKNDENTSNGKENENIPKKV